MNDKRKRYARIPQPGEVPPPQIDKMHSPVYVPSKVAFIRAGAEDHKAIKSLGIENGTAIYRRGHK